jgi:predicted site-specific integrase-resolvase
MGSSSILKFCRDNDISRAFFYKQQAKGRMPVVRKVGARRIITDEDAAEWRRNLPVASPKHQAAPA